LTPTIFSSQREFLGQLLRRLLPLLVLGLLVALRAPGQDVQVDFDRSIDLSAFRRYSWKVHPLLEKDPELFHSVGAELVRMAVNEGLMRREFEPTEDEFADFYVTFFGGRKQRQEVTGAFTVGSGGWYGTGSYWESGWTKVMVSNYVEGTLVLDVVDAKTKQLAWRAYCKGVIRDPSKRDKIINKAVGKALKKFPPKP
jgi:Domain of unknown function (DUF4136)